MIAGSILSKKLAGGADAIVLDVKFGDGAFMRTLEDARALAETLVRVGNRLGKRFSALITAMDQPLGYMAGNALEVRQAIEVLRGEGPQDLREVTLALGAELLLLTGEENDMGAARGKLAELLDSGAAWEKFRTLVAAQEGRLEAIDDPSLLPQARQVEQILAPEAGYVTRLAARKVGAACGLLGAGREVKGQAVDPAAGVELLVKVGDRVEKGQPLARLHVGRPDRLREAKQLLAEAYEIGGTPPQPAPLILDHIR